MSVTAVFTDLDGTLLDEETYSFDEARDALAALAARGFPCVFVTSKTRAEVEALRARTGIRDPFIVENGGAIYLPQENGEVVRMAFGAPYPMLVSALLRASAESECRIRAFHQLGAEEAASLCGLSVEEARLAQQREHDEAFEILDKDKEAALLASIERRGLSWTRGGRFHHIFGGNDKGRATAILTAEFRRRHGNLRTIGLGDSPNDAPFLEVVDIAVVVKSARGHDVPLTRPGVIRTEETGPRGWNRAVLGLIG